MSGYRNRFEAKIAKTLDPAFQYVAVRLPYTLSHQYLPDWIDTDAKRIIEGEGRFTAADRAKMKAVRQQYPDYEITMIFAKPEAPINKGSKTTNADWCDKHGIIWRKM